MPYTAAVAADRTAVGLGDLEKAEGQLAVHQRRKAVPAEAVHPEEHQKEEHRSGAAAAAALERKRQE